MQFEETTLLESLIAEEERLEIAERDLLLDLRHIRSLRSAAHDYEIRLETLFMQLERVRHRQEFCRERIELIRNGQLSFDDYVSGRESSVSQTH